MLYPQVGGVQGDGGGLWGLDLPYQLQGQQLLLGLV